MTSCLPCTPAAPGRLLVQELHELKMKQAVVQTRLNWALQRPSTYQGHELPHTAKQRAARAMCKDLVRRGEGRGVGERGQTGGGTRRDWG